MNDDFQECQSCHNEYLLREGEEPTKYCDPCAHKVAERCDQWREVASDFQEVLLQSDTTESFECLRLKALAAYERLKGKTK